MKKSTEIKLKKLVEEISFNDRLRGYIERLYSHASNLKDGFDGGHGDLGFGSDTMVKMVEEIELEIQKIKRAISKR